MPWFRVDDKFGEHPKVRAIPRARRRNAMGLWILAGAWCALVTSDGHVPGYMVEELCAEDTDATELVRVGLWHSHGHDCEDCAQPNDPDGYVMHGWAELQPTRAEVEAKRKADADRAQKYRDRKRAEREAGDPESTRHASVTRDEAERSRSSVLPGPTRPDPARIPMVTEREDRYETSRASDATALPSLNPDDARCTAHRGIDEPGPCRGCMRARQAVEALAGESKTAAEAAKREKLKAREECGRCGGSGWIETVDGKPAAKCDHRPILSVVGR